MKFTVTTPPVLDPVSLAEAKEHCRVTSDDEDGNLVTYILAARQHVEAICGIALITQTITAYFDSFGQMMLPRWPVQLVQSITYLDVNAVSQAADPSLYYVNSVARPAYIENAYSRCWPSTYYQRNAVTVTFVAGFGSSPGSIPEPIRQAMLLLIGHWHENRETVLVGTIASSLAFTVDALLASYRVYY